MGETLVYEVYDKETGATFGAAATRHEARKLAKELRGASVRRVWARKIVTNRPERFNRCPKR